MCINEICVKNENITQHQKQRIIICFNFFINISYIKRNIVEFFID